MRKIMIFLAMAALVLMFPGISLAEDICQCDCDGFCCAQHPMVTESGQEEEGLLWSCGDIGWNEAYTEIVLSESQPQGGGKSTCDNFPCVCDSLNDEFSCSWEYGYNEIARLGTQTEIQWHSDADWRADDGDKCIVVCDGLAFADFDTGIWDDSDDHCIKCNGLTEGTYFSSCTEADPMETAGDGFCERACGSQALCDERPADEYMWTGGALNCNNGEPNFADYCTDSCTFEDRLCSAFGGPYGCNAHMGCNGKLPGDDCDSNGDGTDDSICDDSCDCPFPPTPCNDYGTQGECGGNSCYWCGCGGADNRFNASNPCVEALGDCVYDTCSGNCNGKWCPKCSGRSINSWGSNQCVDLTTSCGWHCEQGECGANCNDNGDCGPGEICTDCQCDSNCEQCIIRPAGYDDRQFWLCIEGTCCTSLPGSTPWIYAGDGFNYIYDYRRQGQCLTMNFAYLWWQRFRDEDGNPVTEDPVFLRSHIMLGPFCYEWGEDCYTVGGEDTNVAPGRYRYWLVGVAGTENDPYRFDDCPTCTDVEQKAMENNWDVSCRASYRLKTLIVRPLPVEDCFDGIDNDMDGYIDGNDCDCRGTCAEGGDYEPSACDQVTCNGNTYRCHYNNSGSPAWTQTPLPGETACSDTHDNDCDGRVDCGGAVCPPCCVGCGCIDIELSSSSMATKTEVKNIVKINFTNVDFGGSHKVEVYIPHEDFEKLQNCFGEDCEAWETSFVNSTDEYEGVQNITVSVPAGVTDSNLANFTFIPSGPTPAYKIYKINIGVRDIGDSGDCGSGP